MKLDEWGTLVSPWGLTRHPPWWPRHYKPGPGVHVDQGECLPSVFPGGLATDFFSVESCFSKLLTRVRCTTSFAVFLFAQCLPVCPMLQWANTKKIFQICLSTKTCTPKLHLFVFAQLPTGLTRHWANTTGQKFPTSQINMTISNI